MNYIQKKINYNLFISLVMTIILISQEQISSLPDNIQQISVTITESKDGTHSHFIDSLWHRRGTALGYSCSIVPRLYLSDTNNIQYTDILIVSAGCMSIPENGIRAFIMHGKNVYLQCEYLQSYSTNTAFMNLVNQFGGSFSWNMTVEGNLQPMNVLGRLSLFPNKVQSLYYFHYGCAGSGDSTIENFLEYDSQKFGFIFTPPNSSYGKLITSSDQDWVQSNKYQSLMENILYFLSNPIVEIRNNNDKIPEHFSLSQNYPNPFNPITTIKFAVAPSPLERAGVRLVIYDILGHEITTLVNEQLQPGSYSVTFDASNYPSGVYLYNITTGDFIESKKMVLIK
jgi:hypothetical protein